MIVKKEQVGQKVKEAIPTRKTVFKACVQGLICKSWCVDLQKSAIGNKKSKKSWQEFGRLLNFNYFLQVFCRRSAGYS